MRKFLFLIGVGMILSMLTGCLFMKPVTEYCISRVKNESFFNVDFEMLNSKEEHKMTLEKGDVIKITAEHKSGRIDVLVTGPSDDIYKGDDIDDMEFTLTIEEDGVYTFEVFGKDGIGSVTFELVRDES